MRDFKKDLTAVIITQEYDPQNIKFPVKLTEKQRQIDVKELNLGNRAENVLKRAGIETIQNLMDQFDGLYHLRSCGTTTAKEIKNTFLQWWYQDKTDEEIKEFWKSFVEINKVAA